MAIWLLLPILLLGAPEKTNKPEEGVKRLRIAWASQYEWKEDNVENANCEFRFRYVRGTGTLEQVYESAGEFLVVDGKIVRRHYTGLPTDRRAHLDAHIDWIVARFVRQSFEKKFEDVKMGGPEDMPGGNIKISAGKTEYIIRDDRIIAENRPMPGLPETAKLRRIRANFSVQDLSEGYAIHAETARYTALSGRKVGGFRKLEFGTDGEVPVPKHFESKIAEDVLLSTKNHVEFMFSKTTLNAENAEVIDAAARDLLKQAWDRRYTLPPEVRLYGRFRRKPVGNSPRWVTEDVEGLFRVEGMDSIVAQLEGKRYDNMGATRRKTLDDRTTADITWAFGFMKPTAFEAEFKGCGFRSVEERKWTVIEVIGHEKIQAYRVSGDRIVGVLEHATEPLWWVRKIKPGRAGNLVTELKQKREDETVVLKLSYGKTKGYQFPKKFQKDITWGTSSALVEYQLKNVKNE
ncbi:MAG: hypothetical protein V3T86_01375 [Planctomycetota bacterium]